ncbi:MAG: response regulator transcription factor [Niastella sp.]|nr:response regulator transcription factor [Niastella sp.]
MIDTVIIDDEQNNIDNLQYLLTRHCPQVKVVGTARNAVAGQTIIQQQQPALLFLDIQMPEKNGFELLQSLPGYQFEVIFITAFDQYGIQAVKFAAIDYLLKPINAEELKTAVQKVAEKNRQKKQNLQIENLLQLLQHQQQKEEHRIALPTAKETRFARPQDIIRCESTNNYTTFYFNNAEKLMVSRPIYEYEELLNNYGFIRCHQSHLVNKRYIKSWIKEDGNYLLLEDGTQIPVSRQKKDTIKEQLERLK